MFEKVQNKLLVVGTATDVQRFLQSHPHLVATTLDANDGSGYTMAKMSFRTHLDSATQQVVAIRNQWPTLTFILHWLGATNYGSIKIKNSQPVFIKDEICEFPDDYEFDADTNEILEIWNQDLNRHLVVHNFDRFVQG